MKNFHRTTIVAAVLAGACAASHAQAIDQFDVRREGNNAVLQLRFATEVQFQRSVSTRSVDLTQIFYTLINTTNDQVGARQVAKLGAAEGLPTMSITDEIDRGLRNRKILIRTVDAIALEVRAGQGNRSIEIVLIGAGARRQGRGRRADSSHAEPHGNSGRRAGRGHACDAAGRRPTIRDRAAVIERPERPVGDCDPAQPAELRRLHPRAHRGWRPSL